MKIILTIYDWLNSHRSALWGLLFFMTIGAALCLLRLQFSEDITAFLPQEERERLEQSPLVREGKDKITVIFRSQDQDALQDAFYTFEDNWVVEEHSLLDLQGQIPYLLSESDYLQMDSALRDTAYVGKQLLNDCEVLGLPGTTELVMADPLHLFRPTLQRMQERMDTIRLATFSSENGIAETGQNSQFADSLQHLIDSLQQVYPRVHISAVGAPLIAVSNARQIKHDTILALAVALLLILAVLFYVFRSVLPMLWILVSTAWGWLFALGCVALIRPSISLIVIGVGSVIVGIAVNYPLHYLDHLRHTGDRRRTLEDMVQPLLIGNITTVAAFLSLLFLKADAMRDLGLFGACMLLGTLLFTFLFLPHLPVAANQSESDEEVHEAAVTKRRRYSFPLFMVVTVVLGYYSLQTSFDTDLHHINYMTEQQQQDLQLLQQLMPQDEDALVRWQQFWQQHKLDLDKEAQAAGFAPGAFSQFEQLTRLQAHPETYDFATALTSSLVDSFNLIGFLCGFVVFAFLWLSFGRLELALLAFMPMAVGWIWILGLMHLFGIQFNVVNIILATFVFGQGDDYTIFITEGLLYEAKTGKRILHQWKQSVLVSGILMFIGMGALILSQHPAMHSLALVTIIGMAVVVGMAFYLPPLLFPLAQKRIFATFWMYFTIGGGLIIFMLPYTLVVSCLPSTPERRRRYHQVQWRFSQVMRVLNYPILRLHDRNLNGETFEKPCVVVMNHQSLLDMFCMLTLSPRLAYVAKPGMWKVPVLRLILRNGDYLQAKEQMAVEVDKIRRIISEGYSILIFPEGTRTKDGKVGRFQRGACYLAEQFGLDIVPITISGSYEIMPKGHFWLSEGSDMSLTIHPRLTQVKEHRQQTRELHRWYQTELDGNL